MYASQAKIVPCIVLFFCKGKIKDIKQEWTVLKLATLHFYTGEQSILLCSPRQHFETSALVLSMMGHPLSEQAWDGKDNSSQGLQISFLLFFSY